MRQLALPLVVAGCFFAGGAVSPLAAQTASSAEPAEICASNAAAIDKSFATGAYADCETRDADHFKLTIAPEDDGDINCSPWYAFRATPRRAARITIDLDYTTCGHRYWPKTSTDGVNWFFMPKSAVEVEGERGERTARLTLKLGDEPVFVAAQEIFPPSVYDAWLNRMSRAPFAQMSLLGKSAQGRDIRQLRIADPGAAPRETVVLVGRQHPPEVTGALAMLPFVETIMGDSALAKAYRERFETITVPLLNPDGVVRGHWRHNTGGVDLNRDWGPFTQPETALMDGVLAAIERDPARDLRLLIDFHSTNRDVFYTIPDELPTDPPLFTKKWLELYQERMPGYAVDRDARHTAGRPISKAHAFDVYGAPGITFEIGDETDRELIKRIGREAAIAMMVTMLETAPPAAEDVATLITGGTVFDGSGSAGVATDVAIKRGRIVHIGEDAGSRYPRARRIDASGLVVAPGFIDPHTHAGSDLASDESDRRANLPFAYQGVTTTVVGNDGGGNPDIAATARAARTGGIGTNAAYLVGFGPVRRAVLGSDNRAPSAAELAQMEQLTRAAFCEGAWGLSTGLYYVPQNYAETAEVIALARIAAGFGGYYDTHMRDESTYNITVTGAVAETLDIGRKAGLPVHIAHIKALGPGVWGHSAKMIAMIEEARAAGQRVTADQYPWSASGTRVSNALVPRWALEGGLDVLRGRLVDAEMRARIRAEMVEAIARRGGADKLLVTGQLSGSKAPVGKTLADIARDEGSEPVDAALAILAIGDARLASFNMNADDIAAFAAQDWVVTGSDGSTGHPRKYGSFPKAYRDFVQGGTMSLARFIRRSTGQTADIIGLQGRGYLRPGYAADIVVFDPERFAPQATYEAPRALSRGVVHLFVNGVPVIAGGEHTGALPGEPLLKDTSC